MVSIDLSKELKDIGEKAFARCEALDSIVVPSGITMIKLATFADCHHLQDVSFAKGGLQIIAYGAFEGCQSLESICLPSTVHRIAHSAFSDCVGLISVEFSHGLQAIEQQAFQRCTSLAKISIPSGITMIKLGTFSDCHSLHTVNFAKAGLLEVIGNEVFWGCRSLESIRITSTVRIIERSAFAGCTSLVSVELSQGLQVIEQQAFQSCTSLVNIALPSSMQSTAENAFEGCDKLRSLFPQAELLAKRLRHRFDGLPIHRLCYELKGTAEDKSTVLQELVAPDALPTQVDCFGMTVFHILSLSTKNSFGLLLYSWQLVSANVTLVDETDSWGNCPMDYLCRKIDPVVIASIRNIIKVTTQRRVQQLGLTEWQVAVASNCEILIEGDDVARRRRRVYDFYLQLLRYERLEALSLLELALWSQKIDDAKSATDVAADVSDDFKSVCRINCGSDIVISHVLPFLDDLEAGMSFRIASLDDDP
eukprot:scaffold4150_cov117-Cylindrotheca_fusiformis.AAC.11